MDLDLISSWMDDYPGIVKLIKAGVLIFVLVAAKLAVPFVTNRYIKEANVRYQTRKASNLIIFLIMLLGLSIIYSNQLGGLSVAFGVAGAGIAFALQEVIASIAGWAALSFGNFFRIGDRVQLGGIKGDVIDIGFLRTTIMETGEWVKGDQYNGRVVRVANSFVFKAPVYNYSGDFPFLWDEMVIPVRYGSDYDLVRGIILEVAQETAGEFTEEAQTYWNEMLKNFYIEQAALTPAVFMAFNDNWVEFTLRYVVDYKKRRITKDTISLGILKRIEASGGKVKLASTTVEIVEP